jgi:thiol-disulfide isomerase/thioredoxin
MATEDSSMLTRVFVAAVLTGVVAAQEAAKITDFKFSCRTLGGQAISQELFKDNVVIVDLWGTWCPPCRQAIPKLVDLYERYKHQGLEIVGFNYSSNGSGEDAKIVRDFAVENRITYALAIGEPAIREQVPGFNGYPTLLMFKKGLVHDDTHVGFSDGDEEALEAWIRKALELDKPDSTPADRDAAKEKQDIAKEKVPVGKIFMPGNGDSGFEFEATDVDGKAFEFESLRGKPVLMALSTTWDQEAVKTAAMLERFRTGHPELHVIAASMERTRDPEKRREAILKFRSEQKVGYTIFAADLAFTAKVHLFAAVPTLLLFDAEGKLVLREGGLSDGLEDRVNEKLKGSK